MIAVTEMKNDHVENGLNPDKFDERLMTTTTHEITHLLFEKLTAPFNGNEHTTVDESDLMYNQLRRGRAELSTVKFSLVVQAELKVKSNQALVV